MSRRVASAVVLAATALALLIAAGCGEKIGIPEAQGLFSVNAYYANDEFAGAGARQIAVANNILYVVDEAHSLKKLNLEFEVLEQADGLSDPTALCSSEDQQTLFVWEAGTSTLSAWSTSDLTLLGAAALDAVQTGSHLAACRTGMEGVADGAETFVYVTDPDSAVVHRYAWYEGGTVVPMGILCRGGGLSTRFVNEPAGLMVDHEAMMLVCEADTLRNWVNRLDPTPDLADVATGEETVDPWRGRAVVFADSTCSPAVEADYTLGDAPECGETWTGGPSDALGEFHAPRHLAGDGRGWIYVADTENDRIQMFDTEGQYQLSFGDEGLTPAPLALGVVDHRVSGDEVNYGAYVFVVERDTGAVLKFISYDQYTYINQEPPPPPN